MADRNSVQNAARASWIAFVIAVVFDMVNRDDTGDKGAVVSAWITVAVSVICWIAGLAAGVYALLQVKTVGREGVRTPALVGTTLCGLGLLAVALFSAAHFIL